MGQRWSQLQVFMKMDLEIRELIVNKFLQRLRLEAVQELQRMVKTQDEHRNADEKSGSVQLSFA